MTIAVCVLIGVVVLAAVELSIWVVARGMKRRFEALAAALVPIAGDARLVADAVREEEGGPEPEPDPDLEDLLEPPRRKDRVIGTCGPAKPAGELSVREGP